MAYTVEMDTYPVCDLHMALEHTMVEAHYDAQLVNRKWAYVCEPCFNTYGLGLGTGLGQLIVLHEDATK